MITIKWLKLSVCVLSITATVKTAQAQSYVPEWNDSRIKVKSQTAIKAYTFDLKASKSLT